MPDTSDLQELSQEGKLIESYSLLKKKISLSHELIQKYNDAVMETDRVKKELSLSRKEFAKVSTNNNMSMAKNIELQLENNKLKKTVETLEKNLANANIKVGADKKHLQQLNDKVKHLDTQLECLKIEESLKQKELSNTIAELKKQMKVPKEKKTVTESSSQTDSIQKKRYRDVGTMTEASKIDPCKCSTNYMADDPFRMKQILFCQVCTRSIDSTLCSLCELEYKLKEGLVPPIVDMIEESLRMESTMIVEEKRAPTPITDPRDKSCQMNKIKSDKEDLHTLVQEMQRKIDLMEKKQRKITKMNKSKNHSCCHQNSPNVSQSFVSTVPANFSFMNDFCASMFEGFKQHLVKTKRKRKASPIVKNNKISSKRVKLNATKWIESPSSDCAESPQEYQDQPSPAIPRTSNQEVSRPEMESLIIRKNGENWMELNSQVGEDSTKRLMEDFEKDQNCASTPKSTKSPIQVSEPSSQKSAKKSEPIEDQIREDESVSQPEKHEALQGLAPTLPEEEVPAVEVAPEPPSPIQLLTQSKLKKEIDLVEKEPQVEQENPTEDPLGFEERLGSISIEHPIIQPSIPITDPIIEQSIPITDPTPQTFEPPEIKINTEQLKKSPDNSTVEDPKLENNLISPTSPPPSKINLLNDLFGEECVSNKAKSNLETVSTRSETSNSDSEYESAIKSEDKMDCGRDDFESPQSPDDFESPQSPDDFESPQSPDSFESPQSPDGFESNNLPIIRKVEDVYPVFDETSSQAESEINEPEQPELNLKARLAQTFINFQKSSDDNNESGKAESSGGKGRNGRVTLNRKIDRQKSILSKLRKLKKNPPVIVAAKPKSDPIPPDTPKRPILPEVIDYNPKKQRIAHSKDPKSTEVTPVVKKPHIAILSVETIPKKTAIKLTKSKTDDDPNTEAPSPALVSTILKDMEQSFKDFVPKTQKKCFDLRNMYANKDANPVDKIAEKVDPKETENVIEKEQNKTVEKTVEDVPKCGILTRSKADKNELKSSKDLQSPVKKVDNSLKNVSSPAKKVPSAKKKNNKSNELSESYSDMICNESFGVPSDAECSKELRTRKVPVKRRGAGFIDGIPNSLKKKFPDPNVEKGPVPSVLWMLHNYFLDEFKTPRGLRKRAPIEWRKIKYAEGQIKRVIDDEEWSMTVHNSVIENLVEHCTSDFIINGILNYLCSIEQVEEKDLTFSPPAPIMTKTQQKIVTLINCLEPHFPTIFKETLAAIEFSLFRLNSAPSNEKIELLSVLFVALARIKKDRAKVRMFCVDALYCYNLKAVVVIHCALRNWPEVLPIYGTMDDKLALCIMMIIMNMNNPCGSYPKLRNLKQLITLHYQYPTGGISSAEFVEQCFVDLLNHPEKHTAINTALILLSKKESHEWSYKNIITGGLLQSIINKTHPSTYAAYDLLGCILRSFPTTDSDNVVKNIMEQLCDLLDAAEGPHHEQESIARALLSLSRHDFFKVAKSIVKWKPKQELRPDTINKLECFFHFQPMERWRIFILNGYVPFSKRTVAVTSGAKI